jgi:hypothetical protein
MIVSTKGSDQQRISHETTTEERDKACPRTCKLRMRVCLFTLTLWIQQIRLGLPFRQRRRAG